MGHADQRSDEGEVNEIVWEIFYYCRNVLRMKPRGNVYPYLRIYPRKRTECYGEYSSFLHLVELYPSECESLRRLVDTTIHEYTHSCQSWIGVHYSTYTQKFGYKNNPFVRSLICVSHFSLTFILCLYYVLAVLKLLENIVTGKQIGRAHV